MEEIQFLNPAQLKSYTNKYGSPLYIYSEEWLKNRAKKVMDICSGDSVTVRYAIKANPHPDIISIFDKAGLEFDASSDFEAELLLAQGIAGEKISLSSQQPPKNMVGILSNGVKFVATSLHQLEMVSKSDWKGAVGVRINPGIGSGHNNRTTTGGRNASFGIWHEYIPRILDLQEGSGWNVERLHIHIGSGADPKLWQSTIRTALEIVKLLPSVVSLDIGGGFKIARVEGEQETDLDSVIDVFMEELSLFKKETGRSLELEIEPGTWLVGNSGVLVSEVIDIVDTGDEGHTFLKLNTGMNDILRPSLYGAQHPIEVINDQSSKTEYVVVGHNCETGDILTPEIDDPEGIKARTLITANIGDFVAIGGSGAYCASMRATGYNSFPMAGEIVV